MGATLVNPVIRHLLKIPPACYLFLILLICLWVLRPHMLNINIMGIFIRQIVPLGILVLGQLLVMRVKSIDLSGGGVILLINYFISSGLFAGASIAFFIFIALLTGLAVGLLNGIMIGWRRVSAVIVTLAVSIILIGIVQFLSSGKPPGDVPSLFNDIYNTKLWLIPAPVIFWLILTIMLWLFLSRTVFGKYVASIGASPEAAYFSGVPVERTVILAHTLAGLMTAIAALVQTASIAVGSVRLGLDLPILAVAATILGGVMFGRGAGGVWGPFFGVLSFALLFVGMTVFGIDEPGKLIVQGAIILMAAIFYGIQTGKS